MIKVATALLLLLAVPALAHDWFPVSCCSGRDCEHIPIDGVEEQADGYKVHYMSPRFGLIDTFVKRELAKPSQDGGYAGCWYKNTEKTTMICFFYPTNV